MNPMLHWARHQLEDARELYADESLVRGWVRSRLRVALMDYRLLKGNTWSRRKLYAACMLRLGMHCGL
jgi:hypothetical protein